ncbi:hypothetical protein RchiOBHm_Chr1g0349451 [Rosa chinensis]|uniref:Uncharacterized protein n=1 Tax=Rosa chinensis TaxID=74649 RepID=A0A2P6SFT9_ROSCH|nr:hypothetical protein RchiOBHm_Chr1g0349451 [Rosa chinensis]
MTSLRRSSMSFRRQGSSGRIWEDRLQIVEHKSGHAQAIFSGDKSNDEDLRNLDGRFQDRRHVDLGSPSSPSTSTPNSKQEQKAAQRCALSSIFGRCMGSPTAA